MDFNLDISKVSQHFFGFLTDLIHGRSIKKVDRRVTDILTMIHRYESDLTHITTHLDALSKEVATEMKDIQTRAIFARAESTVREFKKIYQDGAKMLSRLANGQIDAATLTLRGARTAFNELRRKARSCLLYTSPSPRDRQKSRMPSSA